MKKIFQKRKQLRVFQAEHTHTSTRDSCEFEVRVFKVETCVKFFLTMMLACLSSACSLCDARMIFLLDQLWRAAKAFGTTCRSTYHATKILFAHHFCRFQLADNINVPDLIEKFHPKSKTDVNVLVPILHLSPA